MAQFIPKIYNKIIIKILRYFWGITKSKEEHVGHLRKVFKVLRKNKLYENLKKCVFMTNSLLFLGYVMSSEGIKVYKEKVKAIGEWPTPKNVNDVRRFYGLATIYMFWANKCS